MLTQFPQLNALLRELNAAVADILGDAHVGTYVQGSFALGAGDEHSDCDFIVATTVAPAGEAEARLRALHDEIPTRPGFWSGHLEGSYADVGSLRGQELGVPWLFCDHGHRELAWDTHCNTLHTRWILRNRGLVVAGPPPATLVDEVPADALRATMRAALPGVVEDVRTWAPMDIAWTQRYLVATYCRVLYTLFTAEVESKRGAMQWAMTHLDERWRPLLRRAIEDRSTVAWDSPARPGSMAETLAFAAYAESLAD